VPVGRVWLRWPVDPVDPVDPAGPSAGGSAAPPGGARPGRGESPAGPAGTGRGSQLTGRRRSTVISLKGWLGSPGAYWLDGSGQPVNLEVLYSSQATP